MWICSQISIGGGCFSYLGDPHHLRPPSVQSPADLTFLPHAARIQHAGCPFFNLSHTNRRHSIVCNIKQEKLMEAQGFVRNVVVRAPLRRNKTLKQRKSRMTRCVISVSKEALSADDWWNPACTVAQIAALKPGKGEFEHSSEGCRYLSENFSSFAYKHEMSNMEINKDIVANSLRVCSGASMFDHAGRAPSHIIDKGSEIDSSFSSNLFDMYVKFGCLQDARMVFDKLPIRNVVMWNKLIAGYAKQGDSLEAVNLFKQMQQECIQPNRITLICTLKACSNIAALEQGRWIHGYIIEKGLELGLFVANTLIYSYIKCQSLDNAQILFNRLPKQDIVAWNVLILGHLESGHILEVFLLYEQMQEAGMEPDLVTYVYILKACSSMAAIEQGRQTHLLIIESGFESDVFVGSTLIDMYAKCSVLEKARIVFDRLPWRNVVTWSSLITGYVEQGLGQEALQLFEQMQDEGTMPNQITFACILKACSSIPSLEEGMQIHACLTESDLELDTHIGSALIDMYAKCGSLDDAQAMFGKLPKKNIVTWSALIQGFAQHGNCKEALQHFEQMQLEGIKADQISFIHILKACSGMAALTQAKKFHAHIIECGFESDLCVGSALIDVYAKVGSLEDACVVFDRSPRRDVATWSSLIAGFGQHGDYLSALQHFEKMKSAGLMPDDVTFLCVLSACSCAGAVSDGCLHFKAMREDHKIAPTLEHYNSMVDILGHAGCVTEAEDLLDTIPYGPNVAGWTSLLSSCRTIVNLEIGKRCFDLVVRHGNPAGYVLMSYMYAQAGMEKDAERVEELRRCANSWKKPARAYIEIDSEVHAFSVGGKVHPHSEDIYTKLKEISLQMLEKGYKPRLDLVLDPIPDENKANILCGHCEKSAIAFGLIRTAPGTTLRVAKNLRMCADCHNFSKVISKMEIREIIVSDAYRIHCFQDGICSCNDCS